MIVAISLIWYGWRYRWKILRSTNPGTPNPGYYFELLSDWLLSYWGSQSEVSSKQLLMKSWTLGISRFVLLKIFHLYSRKYIWWRVWRRLGYRKRKWCWLALWWSKFQPRVRKAPQGDCQAKIVKKATKCDSIHEGSSQYWWWSRKHSFSKCLLLMFFFKRFY